MNKNFDKKVLESLNMPENNFHPLVHIWGEPKIEVSAFIGFFSEVNAKDGLIYIGENCDIASFVAINCADSHRFTLGLDKSIKRGSIILENNVFVGSHSFIGGDTHIGHHSVVGAGTILINSGYIPAYSLVIGNPAMIKAGYYRNKM